jgi:uncharacterized protein YdaU (DUF1376 family)
MNWYGHHIGDWLKKTSDLTLVQEGVYRRLVDWYYAHERPLPLLVKDVCKIARATGTREREAVSTVLHRFFEIHEDGWHNPRVDEEVSRYVEREPERVAKKDAWRARQQRARERRVAMFLALRDVGVVPPFNSTMAALRLLMEEHGVTLDVTRDSERDPRSNPQPTTNIRTTYVDVTRDVTTRAEEPDEPPEPPIAPTRAGQACRAMRAAGMPDVNPAHPQLLRLLKAGVTDDELRMAAATAVAKHKPFAYALAIVEGQRKDAASAGPVSARQSAQNEVVEAWVPALASRRPGGLP